MKELWGYLKQKKYILGLGVVSLLLLLISFLVPQNKTPNLVRLSPKDNSRNISTLPTIQLYFNIPLNSNELSIQSVPESRWIIIQSTENDKSSFIVQSTTQLRPNTQYSLSIYWNQILLKNITYHTEETQTDYDLRKKIDQELATNYPLAYKVPHVAPGYRVIYAKEKTFEITITDNALAKDNVINLVRDWVKENGLNPDSHTYVFAN